MPKDIEMDDAEDFSWDSDFEEGCWACGNADTVHTDVLQMKWCRGCMDTLWDQGEMDLYDE